MNALEVLNQTKDAITVRRVYGDPYQQDGVTIIPAANVMGGGGGGGDTEGNGGGGFGMSARAAGAWGMKDGEGMWRPALGLNCGVLMGSAAAGVGVLVARTVARAALKRGLARGRGGCGLGHTA